jgi:acyl dehydratase
LKFAEFHPGQVIDLGPIDVTEAEVLAFAERFDPQWFHTDPVAAAQGPYGGLIASGWQTCGLVMRLVVQQVLTGSESFGSPGAAYLKWLHPVRPGDSLRVRATVLEVRRSQSKPNLGVLRWRWQAFNQQGTEVMDLEATSLFDLS